MYQWYIDKFFYFNSLGLCKDFLQQNQQKYLKNKKKLFQPLYIIIIVNGKKI